MPANRERDPERATVVIKDSVSGEELKGESPYQCR